MVAFVLAITDTLLVFAVYAAQKFSCVGSMLMIMLALRSQLTKFFSVEKLMQDA